MAFRKRRRGGFKRRRRSFKRRGARPMRIGYRM